MLTNYKKSGAEKAAYVLGLKSGKNQQRKMEKQQVLNAFGSDEAFNAYEDGYRDSGVDLKVNVAHAAKPAFGRD